ncbi:MAG: hypothetical protein ACJ75J_14540 [Cytophagaceae bacterium]
MKKLVSTFIVLFAMSCTSVQDSPVANEPKTNNQNRATAESLEMQYYLVRKPNGELYIRQYDKIIPVKDKTVIMDDGVIVTPSGKIYLADGRRFQIHDGRKIYLSGSKAGEVTHAVTARK